MKLLGGLERFLLNFLSHVEKKTRILTRGIVNFRFLREVMANSSYSKQATQAWAAQSTPSQWLRRPLPNIKNLLFGCLHALYAHSLYVQS